MGERVEDGPGPVLIATKRRPPTVRDLVVPRERLLDRLGAGSGLALSLVACPAGFGKTTLLAAWREAEAARRPTRRMCTGSSSRSRSWAWSSSPSSRRTRAQMKPDVRLADHRVPE